jgi:hypothetical protein
MARSSYPDPAVPGKVLQLGDQEVNHRAGTGWTHGTVLSSCSRVLLGCSGPRRWCAVGQMVPAGGPGKDLEGTIGRRLRRRSAL